MVDRGAVIIETVATVPDLHFRQKRTGGAPWAGSATQLIMERDTPVAHSSIEWLAETLAIKANQRSQNLHVPGAKQIAYTQEILRDVWSMWMEPLTG